MGRAKAYDEDRAVAAAVEVFRAKGYRATTPRDLEAALGIGRGSLYHAFGSKHGLYERALGQYVEAEAARYLPVLEGPGTAIERLRAALGIVLDQPVDPRGCLVTTTAVELAPDDEVAATVVRRVFERQVQVIRGVIEDGRRTGEIGPGADAGAIAELMLALLNGARVLHRAGYRLRPDLVDAALRLL